MTNKFVNFGIFINLINFANCLNILQVVPGASDSHVNFNYKFSQMLYNAGHNVTLLTLSMPFGAKLLNTNCPKGIQEIRFTPILNKDDEMGNFMDSVFKPLDLTKMPDMFAEMLSVMTKVCHQFIDQDEILEDLKERNFDIILAHFFTQCPVGIAKLLNVSKILWVVPGTFIADIALDVLGLPNLPSYMPYYVSEYSDHMTFMERVTNFGMNFAMKSISTIFPTIEDVETEAFRKFPNPPNFEHLKNLAESNVQGLLLNGENALDFPRPFFTNTFHMGDLTPKKAKSLSLEWETFVDQAESGIIIFSLGTIADTTAMPIKLKEAFFNAFIKFSNYSVIWRLEGEMPNNIENYKSIKIVKWLPQIDLLNHPKCKLFITHGGYNSLVESVQASVPMILMPLFADQHGNVKRAVRHGLGLSLDRLNHDSSVIFQTINEILSRKK